MLRRALSEAVVDFLRFSEVAGDHLDDLRKFRTRDWESTLTWLHDAGLALYFLDKLKRKNATDVVPAHVLFRLEQSLAANQARVAFMSKHFDAINRRFDAAGVRYAAVKGFALVPEFCPNASLRHQSDCDYLLDEQSQTVAMRLLQENGYSLQKQSAREAVFMMPSPRIPARSEEQYDASAAFAVELHLSMWDQDIYHLFMKEPRLSLENSGIKHWKGMSFRALPDEDAFVLQVLHAFHHILTCWIRMSWLYEIGYFLHERSTDASLWSRIAKCVGEDPQQREIVVIVSMMAEQFFGVPVPPVVQVWAENLRPAVRVWIENYARKWAFGRNHPHEFTLIPTTKLALFLHREFASDRESRKRLTWLRLLPSIESMTRLLRRRSTARQNASAAKSGWRERKKMLLRASFHITSDLRYLWEIPRWRRLNKQPYNPTTLKPFRSDSGTLF